MRAHGWAVITEHSQIEDLRGPFPISVDGQDAILWCGEGEPTVTDRWCPHKQADLSEGHLVDGLLKCPLHGFMFDMESGRCISSPRFAIRIRQVRREGEDLLVRLSADDQAESSQRDPVGR